MITTIMSETNNQKERKPRNRVKNLERWNLGNGIMAAVEAGEGRERRLEGRGAFGECEDGLLVHLKLR